jgi:uncharacterized protein (DUF305 family)
MNKLAALLAAVTFVAVGCGGDDDGAADQAGGQETTASGQVPFDQAFIDAMVPHHREAIEMAKAANSRGLTQPDLRKIANDIVRSQQREIDQMLDWHEQWFGSRKLGPVLPEVLGVPEGELGMKHGSADEVAGAVDVDAKFAEMMIPHHEGAIAMAEAAKERGQHQEVKDLADAIIAAQEREIGIMEEHASGEVHG